VSPRSNQPTSTDRLRYILLGSIVLGLMAAGVTLSAMGRPLQDLQTLVTIALLPILGAFGYTIKEQTNGNHTRMMELIEKRDEEARQDRAMYIAMFQSMATKLHQSPPPPAWASRTEEVPRLK
jgi:hypothetical protein